MLALVNTNLMRPPIAPIGLDYIATATRAAGIATDVLDLGLASDPDALLRAYFEKQSPRLVGLSFRNVDDSFFPSMQSFLPVLQSIVRRVRGLTDAPIALGGSGYSIFAEQILERTGADFGIRGDGERATIALCWALQDNLRFEVVPGLLWRRNGKIHASPPAWPDSPAVPTTRDAIDNATYLRLGGQIGLETKRGCDRRCIFCADVVAKGASIRARPPAQIADEVEALLAQGIDVLHLCDAEFNIPYEHAMAVCEEFRRRGLGERIRWYAYLSVVPFDGALAIAMRRAGCAGINFTGPAASDTMLAAYDQPHRQRDIAVCARACRQSGITVMLDLMLGGPGETPQTVADAVAFVKGLPIDCVGAALGVRLHPDFPICRRIAAEGPLERNPGLRRSYSGPIDLVQPTFYVSPALGEQPAQLVRDCIAGDKRFFEPSDETEAVTQAADNAAEPRGHNYNDNDPLARAIAAGARGAYWDILRKLRTSRGGAG
jgi:tryptophan 2-C-methyltransferase